jgi:uncharacterized protein
LAPSPGAPVFCATRPSSQRALLTTAVGGIVFGAALILANAAGIFTGPIRIVASPFGTVLLALGYGAATIAIANLPIGKRLLGWAAPLGRMAFTN